MQHPMRFSRRRFCQTTAVATAFSILGGRASAQAANARLKFAVIGINHEHIFRMVQAVKEGGGELALVWAENAQPELAAKFFKENSSVRQARSEAEVLEAPDISFVVTAAPPAERAQTGIRIMRAGKDVLADKGGFLALDTLAEARRVQAETKRIYSISYSERLLMPVSLKVDELLRAGAIGRVSHMTGIGPHGLTNVPREPWFWTRAGRGGIIADAGTHQADQFLHYTGSTRAEVITARAINQDNPDHPEFEDFGEAFFQGDGGTAHVEVSFYRGKSAGFRLFLAGSEGSLFVDKHPGRIVLTRRDGKRQDIQADLKARCPFGRQLVDDVLNRTETAMPQAHAFLASELAVRAQLAAIRTK